jgi:alginate O-acetyltransferase complex protein AlgI
MLFNSYIFMLVFLPITLGVYFFLGRRAHYNAAMGWLVLASLTFYGWWNPVYLWLIAASMLFNYWTGVGLSRVAGRSPTITRPRALLWVGVAVNLALLSYYKYANFFIENVTSLLDTDYTLATIVLPLGISFFTFTQIAYLVDAYRGEAREYNFIHYTLFVTYFPHLIAGPVLHHKEMMPQFAKREIFIFNRDLFGAGVTYFIFGLFKKVVLADTVAAYGSPIFALAQTSNSLTAADAWSGALAYTFQIYFDFSGYSDMAVGLAMMTGIRLPLNFDSPYKATNIIDFWRRWHMTLSRFLREYLYIALGGNRQGTAQRYANLLLTMLLGGLWHGAGWTFVIWGALHGIYLIANHGWQTVRRSFGIDHLRYSALLQWPARLLTFISVVIGWVFFRASDWQSAATILSAMFSFEGWAFSADYAHLIVESRLGRWWVLSGLTVNPELLVSSVLCVLYTICVGWPNTQQIMWRVYRRLDVLLPELRVPSVLQWQPTPVWSLLVAAAAVWSLLGLTNVSEFLYFQF